MKPAVSPVYRSAIRTAATVITAGASLLILTRATVPEGRLTVTSDFSGPAPFVSEAKLPDRIGDPVTDSDGVVRRPVRSSPVYLDLKPPSEFDSVTVKLRYAAAGAGDVEIGALSSAPDDRYDMRGVGQRLLDVLGWGTVSNGDLTLFQRKPTFVSVDDFLRSRPPTAAVATYLAEPPSDFRIKDYVASEKTRTIAASLRGGHRMLTYVKGETLDFSLVTQDMNRETGADPAYVTVYRIGSTEPLASASLEDDGNASDDQKSSKLRTVSVSMAAPSEGAYRMEFTTTPDVFIREIRTKQSKLAFEGWMFLGDFVGYSDRIPAAKLAVSGTRLAVRTPHAEGMQTVTIGNRRTVLDMPNEPVEAALGAGLTEVESPKRNVLVESDGVLALSDADWFDPFPYRIGATTTASDLDARGIDYVLAAYRSPEAHGQALEAVATFDMSKLVKTETGAYRFAFASGGAVDDTGGISLESASFALRRDRSGWLRWLFASAEKTVSDLRVLPAGRSFGEKIN